MLDRTAEAGPILVYSEYAEDLPRFERLLSAALPGVEIHYARSLDEAAPHLERATIFYGWGFPVEVLRRMPELRWVQKMGAGVDDIISGWPCRPEVILTRTDGKLIAPRMSEYVLGAILDKSVRFDLARHQQAHSQWNFFEVATIRSLTIGIAGVGEIGATIAATLRLLGAQVIGWRRTRAPSPGIEKIFVGNAALPEFLGRCDVVVLVLPLTSATHRLFNAHVLDCCRSGVHLINVGRGGVLDEQDLLRAIASRRVRHATLDVFGTEPLPREHPFWTNPHVTITPHVCGPLVPADVVPHFVANHAAFIAGKPLMHVVDLDRQY
jgi:glyoxylate/hydroxypyruvate reductase A